ncbi:MAG: isopenicillin N synthase family oxygenase [Alphaproteobacteria bacterium]|nr:isopenicillin N synthase family oxygenase [Alphaproteobacteria bacterium]MBV8411210.1 isopenicillin N synthase family oxygenase [Alphaproteobacteria bacterium]
MSLPIVDVGSLWRGASEGDLSRLGAQVFDACRSMGFFYIVNHGVPSELIGDAFAANRRFHALPIEEKLRIKLNRWHRGYQALGGSKLVSSARFAAARHPNQLESFFLRHEVDPADPSFMVRPLQGPNQWPGDPRFCEAVERYDRAMCDAGMRLLKVFSTAIGERPDFFARRFSPPTTALRLIHYPPAPRERPHDLYGAHPHTDYGFLTVLAQDDVGGLEVRRPDGGWMAVPFVADSFIVNIGDTLARWTNDGFNSTPHRVVNASPDRDRYSIGYFFDPSLDTEISTLPRFREGAASEKYASVRYADYFNGRLDANYQDRVGV